MDSFVFWCALLAIYLLAMCVTAGIVQAIWGPDPDLAARWDRDDR